MWLIAPYLRLSREDERKGKDGRKRLNDDSDSIANQQAVADEFISTYFADVPHKIVDYFKDDGLTGTDDTREDFTRLIDWINQGKVNCVVVKTLARAFRNYSDQGYYLEYFFPLKKVRFICISSPRIDTYDNPDAVSGYEVPISGVMNDRFAAQTSSAVRQVFDTKRRNGEYIGAFAPYGYLKDPQDKHHLILDDEIYALKRDILGWVVRDGMSWMGIARKLNDLGIPNPTAYKHSKGWKYRNPHAEDNGGLWCGTTVKRMMLDPVNLGHMVQGRQRVISYKVHDRESVPENEWYRAEDMHEPTFSQEEYNTLVSVSMRDTRTPNQEMTLHLLSGFVRCADCRKALRRKVSRGSAYYFCRTYELSKAHCTKRAIRESVLEEALLAAIHKQISFLASLAVMVEDLKKNPNINMQSDRISKLIEERRKDLERAKKISDSLYADWKTDVISGDEYARMKAQYVEQIKGLETAIANLENEQKNISTCLTSESAMFNAFLRHENIDSLDRGVLAELVDVVLVTEDKDLMVKFRYADELVRIMEMIEQNAGLQGGASGLAGC